MIHAYGVVSAEPPTGLRPGIAGASVSTVTVGRLNAVVSTLPSDEFSLETWQQNADNVVWLGKIALEHNRVLKEVIRFADIVPLRLPSIFLDIDELNRVIDSHSEQLEAALGRVRGKVEWAVKIFRAAHDGEQGETESPTPGSGSGYLQSRSEKLRARATAQERMRQRVLEIQEHLDGNCVDSVRNPPQASVLTGIEEPMLLNAAYLVDRDQQGAFHRLVAQVAETAGRSQLVVESTGPWPAYNFTDGLRPERGSGLYDH